MSSIILNYTLRLSLDVVWTNNWASKSCHDLILCCCKAHIAALKCTEVRSTVSVLFFTDMIFGKCEWFLFENVYEQLDFIVITSLQFHCLSQMMLLMIQFCNLVKQMWKRVLTLHFLYVITTILVILISQVDVASAVFAGSSILIPKLVGNPIWIDAAFQCSGNHRKKTVNTNSPAVNTVPVTTPAGDHRRWSGDVQNVPTLQTVNIYVIKTSGENRWR